MGVIQNSLNSMLATLMGGVIGAKHIAGQQKQLEQSEMTEIPKKMIELGELDEQIDKDAQTLDTFKGDIKKYGQGQIKTYLPNDRENPIWVNKSGNEEEWSNQFQMSLKGLRKAASEIAARQMQRGLTVSRFDELVKKHIDPEFKGYDVLTNKKEGK